MPPAATNYLNKADSVSLPSYLSYQHRYETVMNIGYGENILLPVNPHVYCWVLSCPSVDI